MSEIADFIAKRLAELEPKHAALLAQIQPIATEITELRLAKEALGGCSKAARRRLKKLEEPQDTSIQGMCMKALRSSCIPLTASQIQGWISVNCQKDIVRTSLAPQLSRLCADGWAENVGGGYRLTQAANTSGGQADGSR